MAIARIPLVSPLDTRDEVVNKDAVVFNGYMEDQGGGIIYVIKRAGIYQEVAGGGTAQGIFAYGSNLYSFDSAHTGLTPLITPISSLV